MNNQIITEKKETVKEKYTILTKNLKRNHLEKFLLIKIKIMIHKLQNDFLKKIIEYSPKNTGTVFIYAPVENEEDLKRQILRIKKLYNYFLKRRYGNEYYN